MSGGNARRPAGPSRRERGRPWELVGIAAVMGVVIGVLVFFGTHRFMESLIWTGITFVVALVGLAMLALTTKPEMPPEGEMREALKRERDAHGPDSP